VSGDVDLAALLVGLAAARPDLTDDALADLWARAVHLDDLGGAVRPNPLALPEFDPDDGVWAGIQEAAWKELAPAPMLPWRQTARPKQLPPPGRWRHWLLMAGRGFGKTFCGSNWLAERALAESGDYAIIAPTLGDAKAICVEGPSGLLKALGGENGPHIENYNRSEYTIYLVNGSRIRLGSADAPARIRGWNFRAVWCDEVGSWVNLTVWNEGVKFATRIGNPQIMITTTPTRGNKILIKLLDDHAAAGGSILGGLAGNTYLTRGSTRENERNLSRDWLDEIEEEFGGTELGRQELDGELLRAVPGALITMDIIEHTRLTAAQVPDFHRVAVGVDPSVSESEDSDECGIVVMGIGPAPVGWEPPPGAPAVLERSKHLYVLEDASLNTTPEAWARRALDVADEWDAHVLTPERNNGGALVTTMVRMVAANEGRRMPRIGGPDGKGVWAAHGKLTRAEPMGGVWQQHRVHVVGRLKLLEDQWQTWVPRAGRQSPDRFDASVWAGVELMPQLAAKPRTRLRVAGS
jgi:phage terminase large subunit-like protein